MTEILIPIPVLEEMLRSEYTSVTQNGEEARRRLDESREGSRDHIQASGEVVSAFSKQVGLRRIARVIEEYSGVKLDIYSPIPPETTSQEPK